MVRQKSKTCNAEICGLYLVTTYISVFEIVIHCVPLSVVQAFKVMYYFFFSKFVKQKV